MQGDNLTVDEIRYQVYKKLVEQANPEKSEETDWLNKLYVAIENLPRRKHREPLPRFIHS